MTKNYLDISQASAERDPLDYSFSEREIAELTANAQAAAAPETPNARALRIKQAEAAIEGVRTLAKSSVEGQAVATVEEFVFAVLALPSDPDLRRHALNSAQARVKARTDLSGKVKLTFIAIAQWSMGKYRHCFALAEMIALETGIRHTSDISRSVTKLAELGLIFTYHNGQRLFMVPALAEVDCQILRTGKKGAQPAFIASRLEASQLTSKANVCYPCEAVLRSLAAEAKKGELSFDRAVVSNDRHSSVSTAEMVSFDTKSASLKTGAKHTPLAPVNTLSSGTPVADENTSSAFRETVEEIQGATAATQPAAAPSGSEDDFTGTDAYTPAKMSREEHAKAHALTNALTAAEIAKDYADYLAADPAATLGQFLRGLKYADNEKRERVASRLGDGTNKFLKWDRDNNGYSKETLNQRISRFGKLPSVPDPQRRSGAGKAKHQGDGS